MADPLAITDQAAAIARLEVQVQHLIEAAERRERAVERMAAKLDVLEQKLDEAKGGFAVLRWFGFGSLASLIALGAAIYGWTHRE